MWQRTLHVDWPSSPCPPKNQTTWTIFIFWVLFDNLSMKDDFPYFFLSNFPLDASLNSMLPPVILPLLDLFLNKSDVHQSYRLVIREQLLSSSKEDPRSSARPQQHLEHPFSPGVSYCFYSVFQRIDLLDQRRDHNAFLPQGLERRRKEAAAGADHRNFVDDEQGQRQRVVLGQGALENQGPVRPNALHRQLETGGRAGRLDDNIHQPGLPIGQWDCFDA